LTGCNCGPRGPGTSLIVPNPMIVVEARDYFTLPSLQH
jgi:hypothetical protein